MIFSVRSSGVIDFVEGKIRLVENGVESDVENRNRAERPPNNSI